MPPLPPKPEVPPIVTQALIVAALSTSACAAHRPPRIGQPPPVRIGAEESPPGYGQCEVHVVDEQGGPLRARIVYVDGGVVETDESGFAYAPPGDVRITAPGYDMLSTRLCMDSGMDSGMDSTIRLQPLPPPVRIGAEPDPTSS